MTVNGGRTEHARLPRQRLGLFETIIASTPNLMMLVAPDGVVVRAGAAWERLLGWSPARLEGTRLADLLHPDDAPADPVPSGRSRCRTGGGEYRWLEWAGAPLPEHDLRMLTARDVTEERATAEALRHSEELARTVFEASPLGMVITDPQGHYVRVNRAFAALLGREPEDVVGLHVRNLTHPDDVRAGESQRTRLGLEPGVVADYEKRFVRPDGGTVWVRLRVTAIRGPMGEDYRLGQAENISERKLAEAAAGEALAALRASENRFRLTFDNCPLGMVLTSLREADNSTFLQVNPAMARLTGYSVEQLLRMRAEDLVDPGELIPGVLTAESLEIGDDDTRQSVRRLRHADGRMIWTRAHLALVRDESGTPVYAVSQLEDITGRRLIEEQLRERAHLLDLTQDAVVVRDLDGRVGFWNPAAERIYGWPARIAVGQHLDRLLGTEFADGTDAASVAAALARDGVWDGELGHCRADGPRVTVLSRQAVQRNSDGRPVAVLSINTDVTARRAAERALADRNGELEAANALKRDLIGMLGHEISNPLGTILGYTELLTDPDDGLTRAEMDAAVAAIGVGARRLQAIVREILAQVTVDAGTLTAAPETVPVAEHLATALTAAATPEVPVDCPAGLLASVQPQHLDQILANLLSNAAKYGGGATRVGAAPAPDGTVEIRVEDDGPGVAAEFRGQLFDRFARAEPTSRTVHGTGLGLHIVRELARANGGDVGYRSRENGCHGSVFVLTLRRSSA